jgi:hypothetical protein
MGLVSASKGLLSMKKLVYILGAVFSSVTLLSVLFKLLHLQGVTVLLIVGLGGLAFIWIPAFAKYRYDKSNQ